jgi:hypothetical protein
MSLSRIVPVNMNGVNTKVYLNIIPLGSYDCLIGMDWLDKHHVVLDCYNKAFTCLDEEGNSRTIQGIPRPISVREISTLQLKISFRKGCQIYATHMEEPTKDKEPNIEDYQFLKEYEDVFGELPGFPPKRDIDFSIDLMPGASPVSKDSLQNEHTRAERVADATRRVVEEGVHMPKCFTLGCPSSFCEEKGWNSEVMY